MKLTLSNTRTVVIPNSTKSAFVTSQPLAGLTQAPTAATLARLAWLKGTLAAFGVTDLSALGKLSLSGNVVPQAGITVPQPPSNVSGSAGTVVFKNATQISAVTGSAATFERIGGSANVIYSRPFPTQLLGIGGTGSGQLTKSIPVVRHNTIFQTAAFWAAAEIDLADNTNILLVAPTLSLFIITPLLTVGNNVTFSWEQPALPSAGTIAQAPMGSPSPAATPYRSSGLPEIVGITGQPGSPGGPGNPGFGGYDGPDFEIWTLQLVGSPSFDYAGQNGSTGGPGQQGGNGGAGSNGGDAQSNMWGCTCGPAPGGDGGRGGNGGPGGPGGNGGDGGSLSIYIPLSVDGGTVAVAYDNSSGNQPENSGQPFPNGGPGGAGGEGGAGGLVGSVPPSTQGGLAGCNPNLNSYSSPLRANGQPGAAGMPGPTGSNGFPGTPGNPPQFNSITQAAFNAELNGPHILTLSQQGQSIAINGVNLSNSDSVYVNGVDVTSTFVSATEIDFDLPGTVPGGIVTVFVQAADGSQSNSATLDFIPVIVSVSPQGSIQPGTTVTLTGFGFAPGMRVQAVVPGDLESMSSVQYQSPTTVTFALSRPAAFVSNPPGEFGEPVSIQAVLSTGETSNSVQLTLATFRIVVLGDSVAWGEGLLTNQKYMTLVQRAIGSNFLADNGTTIGVYVDELAHCGAILGVSDSSSDSVQSVNEIPSANPTILAQIGMVQSPATVNLVLVNGGINDVGVQTILNPFTSDSAITTATTSACGTDMSTLLFNSAAGSTSVASQFPNAQIIVTSYYPILSSQSDTSQFYPLLMAIGFDVGGPLGAITAGDLSLGAISQMIANCETFFSVSTQALKGAITTANATIASSGASGSAPVRIFFAAPPFTDANATFAPTPLLWGLNGLNPQDENAAERAMLCPMAFPGNSNVAQEAFCERASVGHPNVNGALAFANAIIPLVTGFVSTFSGTLGIVIAPGTSAEADAPVQAVSLIFIFSNNKTSVQVENFQVTFSAISGGTTIDVACSLSCTQNGAFASSTGVLSGLQLTATAVISPQVTLAPTETSIAAVSLSTDNSGGSTLSSTATGSIVLTGSGLATGGYVDGQSVQLTLNGTFTPVP